MAAPDSLVCVVGEANAWPYTAGPDHPPDELVHWVAHRVTTGETFAVIAAPEHALAPSAPFHIDLDPEALRAGVPRAELLARFAEFSRPGDRLCAWGHYAPSLLAAAGGVVAPGAVVDLRAAAQRFTSRALGTLEDYAGTLGPPPPPLGPGRAGRRAALLAQVVRAWLTPPGAPS